RAGDRRSGGGRDLVLGGGPPPGRRNGEHRRVGTGTGGSGRVGVGGSGRDPRHTAGNRARYRSRRGALGHRTRRRDSRRHLYTTVTRTRRTATGPRGLTGSREAVRDPGSDGARPADGRGRSELRAAPAEPAEP